MIILIGVAIRHMIRKPVIQIKDSSDPLPFDLQTLGRLVLIIGKWRAWNGVRVRFPSSFVNLSGLE